MTNDSTTDTPQTPAERRAAWHALLAAENALPTRQITWTVTAADGTPLGEVTAPDPGNAARAAGPIRTAHNLPSVTITHPHGWDLTVKPFDGDAR